MCDYLWLNGTICLRYLPRVLVLAIMFVSQLAIQMNNLSIDQLYVKLALFSIIIMERINMLAIIWPNSTILERKKKKALSQSYLVMQHSFGTRVLSKYGIFKGYLVGKFKHTFEHFKQHYIHFHKHFHPHKYQKHLYNITQTLLPNTQITAKERLIFDWAAGHFTF